LYLLMWYPASEGALLRKFRLKYCVLAELFGVIIAVQYPRLSNIVISSY
jgi:hypothetical protein